jgi:hypothetical protein
VHKTKGWKGTTSAGKRGGKGGNKLREKGRQRAQKTRREGDNGCRKKRQAGQGEQKKAMGLATPTSERCATMATTIPNNWSLPHLLNVSSRAFTASIGEEIIVLRSCAPDSSLRTMRRDVRHWCQCRTYRPLYPPAYYLYPPAAAALPQRPSSIGPPAAALQQRPSRSGPAAAALQQHRPSRSGPPAAPALPQRPSSIGPPAAALQQRPSRSGPAATALQQQRPSRGGQRP